MCFKANPKDIETLNLLAVAFKDLDQPAKTVSVYRELARIHEAAHDQPSYQGVMRKILAIEPDDAEAKRTLGLAGSGPAPPPIRSGDGPPPRRQSMEISPQQVAQAQAQAQAQAAGHEPTRRVTGEMSPAQVAAVQAVVGDRRARFRRRKSGEASPAQVAQAQQAEQRRPTGEVRETIPSSLPENALGRIVPAHKAVAVGPQDAIREVDRRAPIDEIEVDTDFDEAEDATAMVVDDGLSDQTRETISRILVEAEVYIKYGLKQKAVEHLRKIFALAPDHREARVRYKTLLVDTGAIDEAVQSLLSGMAVRWRSSMVIDKRSAGVKKT